MFPDSFITRPWDVIPLGIYVLSGLFLYPRFYKQNPNLFTHALLISLIPHITTELHMAFGSTSLFDNDFNIAHFLKIFAYVVPLIGLILDYSKTYSEQTSLNINLLEQIKIRKEAEKMNLDLRNALNQAALVSITDTKGKILYVNNEFCKTSQYNKDELIGQDIDIINSGYHTGDFWKDLWKRLGDGKIWKGEIKDKAKDGSYYWVYSTIIPFIDKQNKPYQYLSIMFVITKEKETEHKLLEQNLELEHFAYVVSHDLKAPLRSIDSLANFIEVDLKDNKEEDVISNLALLKGRVHRMDNLIEGILEYSKIGMVETKKEEFDMNQLLSEIIEIQNFPEGFDFKIKTSFPTIIGIKSQFSQLFSNLISNGIKYNDKDQGLIVLDYLEHENGLEFTIEDNGPGIPEKYHDKIFVVFQTLEARGTNESTGIGLSIVKKIIDKLHGTIRLESSENKGTKFIIWLPKQKKPTTK